MIELAYLVEKLQDPKFLHLILEPILYYGIGLGVLAFLLSFLFGERKVQFLALLLVIGSALTVVPYTHFRKQADQPTIAQSFNGTKTLVEEHHKRLLGSQWIYFGVAGLATLALLMGPHTGTPGMIMGFAASAVGLIASVFSVWLSLKSAAIEIPSLRMANYQERKIDPIENNIVVPLRKVSGDTRRAVSRRLP